MKRAYLYAKHRAPPTRWGRGIWKTQRRIGRKVKGTLGPLKPWWSCFRGHHELALVVRAEQAPNPDSRVVLGHEIDATGMPRLQLDWRISAQDIDSAAALVEAFGRESVRNGLGGVEAAEWLHEPDRRWVTDELISAHPIGGFHHMGTTRMADDPRHGVTNSFGQVYGLENLYVAGSSLFPTSGWANPTMTILALTLRTADHLLASYRW